MEHIVKQIVECNTITERLVRITYLKTLYRCPSQAEIEHDDSDYCEDYHHSYATTHHICILSVYGSKDDPWTEAPYISTRIESVITGMRKGKIHAKRLEATIKDINERGVCSEDDDNCSVHDKNHYQLNIIKVERMN